MKKGFLLLIVTLLIAGCSKPATVDTYIRKKLCQDKTIQAQDIELIMLGENSHMRLAAVKGDLYFIEWSDGISSIATKQKISLPPSVLPTPVISTVSGDSEVIKTMRLMEQKNLDYKRAVESKDAQLKKLMSQIQALKDKAKEAEIAQETEKVAQKAVEVPQTVLVDPERPKPVEKAPEAPKADLESFASRYKQVEAFICEE
jgi:hypothetical protein